MKAPKALRIRTGRQFEQVAGGLGSFSARIGHLPFPVRRAPFPAKNWEFAPNGTGRPLRSWRCAIISTMVNWRGESDCNQPWDSPANRETLGLSDFYAYDEAKDWVANGRLFADTNILAITGPGTAFGEDRGQPPMRLSDVPPSTIIAVEVRSSGIPWPAPGDFDIRTMPQTINAPDGKGISSRHAGGFHVIFADSRVWFVSDKVPFETLKKLFTVADAKHFDRERLLGEYVVDRGPFSAEAWRIFGVKLLRSSQAWEERGREEWKKVQQTRPLD